MDTLVAVVLPGKPLLFGKVRCLPVAWLCGMTCLRAVLELAAVAVSLTRLTLLPAGGAAPRA